MAKLELTDDEAIALRDQLDLDIEAWEDELEKICLQPFDTWEELLEHSALSEEMINTLRRLRKQLQDD